MTVGLPEPRGLLDLLGKAQRRRDVGMCRAHLPALEQRNDSRVVPGHDPLGVAGAPGDLAQLGAESQMTVIHVHADAVTW